MLQECQLGTGLIDNMKRGKMPSVDKMAIIAEHLCVSIEYLIGLSDDPTPPKNKDELTDEEQLAAEIFKMSPEKKQQLIQYANFLKTQEEFSQELSEMFSTEKPKLLPD